MRQAATVHRAAFDERLPWLAGLHTPDEDRDYFEGHVFDTCEAWGLLEGARVLGFVAFRDGWIEHLYVLPSRKSLGLGTTLLTLAKDRQRSLRLWTFQRNALARGFYEKRGFAAVAETDGARNGEREPDVLYEWRR